METKKIAIVPTCLKHRAEAIEVAKAAVAEGGFDASLVVPVAENCSQPPEPRTKTSKQFGGYTETYARGYEAIDWTNKKKI